jgi:triacylglycerol lipase
MPSSALGAPVPGLSTGAKLKYPIVLVHGASMYGSKLKIGFLSLGDYWRRLPAFLSSSGTEVKVPYLPDAGIDGRAKALQEFLEKEAKGRKVNIIAHSLGGLDARYLVSVLRSDLVASITTVGTPHHGTPLADWVEWQIRKRSFWYWFFRITGHDLTLRRFLPEMTRARMREFNEKVLNRNDVRYFSVQTSASFRRGSMSYLLWFPTQWMRRVDLAVGEHDGMIPTSSQAWGTVITSSNLIDHLAQINHHNFRAANFESDVFQLYERIYEVLSKAGL